MGATSLANVTVGAAGSEAASVQQPSAAIRTARRTVMCAPSVCLPTRNRLPTVYPPEETVSKDVAPKTCSHECEHGAQECARHNLASDGLGGRGFEGEIRSAGIVNEHLHRVQRILREIAPQQRQLLQQIVRDCDDVTANGIGLHDVEQ